jgi:tetratricopeptide (TPR) repeat protein
MRSRSRNRGARPVLALLGTALLLLPVFVFAQEQADALELYQRGEYASAIDVCKRELQQMPNRMDAYAVMGWSLLRLRRYEEALSSAETALKISRYDPRIVEVAGEALFHLGRSPEALGYFEEYAVIAPTGSRIDTVYYYMGEIFIQQGRYNDADIALSTALYHSPNVADWWARLGYAREKAEDFRYALEAYNKALALNPNLDDAVRGRARVQPRL